MGEAEDVAAAYLTVVCCLICCIFVAPLIFFIVINCQNLKPRCYIDDFYVPALNTLIYPNATGADNIVFLDLQLSNIMIYNGLKYKEINVTVSYGGSPIGNYTVPGFKQGKMGSNNFRQLVVSSDVLWVFDAVKNVANGSAAGFRVDVAMKMKVKNRKTRKMAVGSDVQVKQLGVKAEDKAIRLRQE